MTLWPIVFQVGLNNEPVPVASSPSAPVTKPFERHGAVAQVILCRRGKLAERFTKAPWNEQGIVAEASGTFRLIDDDSLDGAAKRREFVASTRQGNHAPESRLTVLSADVLKILQEQCVVPGICGLLP